MKNFGLSACGLDSTKIEKIWDYLDVPPIQQDVPPIVRKFRLMNLDFSWQTKELIKKYDIET